ncbi:MAG: GumC family protein [Bacteroidales bacterium]
MNFLTIIRLIIRHYKVLIIFPLITAAMAFMMSGDQKTVYQSKASIYTGIASGYSIESEGQSTYNNYKTNNAFDNLINIIKSRETSQETALVLLATHLSIDKPNELLISKKNFTILKNKIPANVNKLIVANNYTKTLENIKKLYNSSDTNFVYNLVNSKNPYYSIDGINSVIVKRVTTSDLIEISYESDDPGICRLTLEILSKVLITNYREIFQDQTMAVVKWFDEQVKLSAERLKTAEDLLLAFNSDNNIINYYEQTKFIAEQKEQLDKEYHTERKEMMASEASKKKLEEKLGVKEVIFQTSSDILKMRNQLTDLINQMVILEADKEQAQNNASKINELKAKIESLKLKLAADIATLFNSQNSTEGIPIDRMLTEWLSKLMNYEESLAKLKAFEQRKSEFFQKYKTFAPLGATLKRIERQIGVCEQEYLERLHSLNLSKLRQQNIELSSNIKVIDKPNFPNAGKTTSKKLLGIIGYIVGLILVLTILILLEIFDTTIKSSERAEIIIGLKVAGLFPNFKQLEKNPQKEIIINRLVDITIRNTFSKRLSDETNLKIAFVSTREEEGKHKLATLFSDRLHQREINCVHYAPESSKPMSDITKQYKPEIINELSTILNANIDKHIIVEIPSLLMNDYPSEVISSCDIVFLVCRSNREWNKADKKTISKFIETTNKTPELILNGVDIYQLENILGELPRTRSKIRKLIKKIITFDFFGSKKF